MELIYDKLLEEADNENLYVIENANFQSQASGLINNDVIGINKNVRSYAKETAYWPKRSDITKPRWVTLLTNPLPQIKNRN